MDTRILLLERSRGQTGKLNPKSPFFFFFSFFLFSTTLHSTQPTNSIKQRKKLRIAKLETRNRKIEQWIEMIQCWIHEVRLLRWKIDGIDRRVKSERLKESGEVVEFEWWIRKTKRRIVALGFEKGGRANEERTKFVSGLWDSSSVACLSSLLLFYYVMVCDSTLSSSSLITYIYIKH